MWWVWGGQPPGAWWSHLFPGRWRLDILSRPMTPAPQKTLNHRNDDINVLGKSWCSKYTHKHWHWGFYNIQIQQLTQKDHGYRRYMYLCRSVFTRVLYFKTAWRMVHLICMQCFLPGMTNNLYFYKEHSASGAQRNKNKTIHRHNKVTVSTRIWITIPHDEGPSPIRPMLELFLRQS